MSNYPRCAWCYHFQRIYEPTKGACILKGGDGTAGTPLVIVSERHTCEDHEPKEIMDKAEVDRIRHSSSQDAWLLAESHEALRAMYDAVVKGDYHPGTTNES